MIDHLFVYGTLMRAAATAPMGRGMRARLATEGDWVGASTIGGRLYDLGTYPGMIRSTRSGDRVHGEIHRLRDPRASFVWLDAYEGLPVGRTRGMEYERVIDRVMPASGGSIDAWVYVLIAEPAAHRLIAEGRCP